MSAKRGRPTKRGLCSEIEDMDSIRREDCKSILIRLLTLVNAKRYIHEDSDNWTLSFIVHHRDGEEIDAEDMKANEAMLQLLSRHYDKNDLGVIQYSIRHYNHNKLIVDIHYRTKMAARAPGSDGSGYLI